LLNDFPDLFMMLKLRTIKAIFASPGYDLII